MSYEFGRIEFVVDVKLTESERERKSVMRESENSTWRSQLLPNTDTVTLNNYHLSNEL